MKEFNQFFWNCGICICYEFGFFLFFVAGYYVGMIISLFDIGVYGFTSVIELIKVIDILRSTGIAPKDAPRSLQ